MKYMKILGFAAIAAAALMAFAGSASATELTNASGMVTTGTTIEAESEGHAVLDSPIGNIECHSTVKGTTINTGGASETVEGKIETLTFTGCTNGAIVTVVNRGGTHPFGTLIIHTEYETITDPNGEKTSVQKTVSTNNGTLTSNGTEVKVNLGGVECIYRTQNTDIGTLTGSATTGGTATLDISARVPEVSGGLFCGTSAPWTGSYKVTNPDTLNVD